MSIANVFRVAKSLWVTWRGPARLVYNAWREKVAHEEAEERARRTQEELYRKNYRDPVPGKTYKNPEIKLDLPDPEPEEAPKPKKSKKQGDLFDKITDVADDVQDVAKAAKKGVKIGKKALKIAKKVL